MGHGAYWTWVLVGHARVWDMGVSGSRTSMGHGCMQDMGGDIGVSGTWCNWVYLFIEGL